VYVTSATGYFLDLIGRLVGVDRLDATAASTAKEDRNIKFYVNTSTLKARLPAGLIPSGTVIQSSDGNIQYTVVEDTPFPDDATEVYVGAVAVGTGKQYRVGRGILTVHNLGDSNIFVTNELPISTGTDLESDDNYRYRILNHSLSRATANRVAVRLAALSAPGVADVVFMDNFRGPGTCDVMLTPVGNMVTESMIVGAQARIDNVKAEGVDILVRGPRYVNIQIETTISFTKDTPDDQKAAVRNLVRDNQIDYLAEIPRGGELIIQELRARTQESSAYILDHQINCLVIDSQPQILRNWKLYDDELFLPDPTVDQPIKVL